MLDEDYGLVPISVLQTAPQRGRDLGMALRHLLDISAFAEPVAAERAVR